MVKVNVITLYPEMFPGPLECSIIGRALKNNIWSLNIIDLRQFGIGKYKKVDDEVFGGGRGMLIRSDVLAPAIDSIYQPQDSKHLLVYLSPHGSQLDQSVIEVCMEYTEITIICGHFEGIDYRIIEQYKPLEISIGDFILTGGELPAMILIECCVRLIPGVVGSMASIQNESFVDGLLEHPHYTRPAEFRGSIVPDVLYSGNHKKIDEWRLRESENITRARRSDLWDKYNK